ncbi:hypothetical protein [Methylobacterium sp. GC_Met_2]|uniref:hypothetical protein n=1 Tax=Methylobacterium sp. GC_Met_2 TaxID=2937376 RepID=UPI00226B08BA|nr:hypothetical protein [Methylobacterium sp. GC_Met_2]
MDEAWKKARLDELWDSYLPTSADEGANESRSIRAIEAIASARGDWEAARAQHDIVGAIVATSRARMLWQLLSIEIGGWIAEDDVGNTALERASLLGSRFELKGNLTSHSEAGPHPHRPAVDPVPVLLPRWVLTELRTALAALDEGETHDIVRPIATGRHGNAWSQDQMRAGALEHVAFLHGQGQTKKIAQQRVAAQMNVPATTLRDWERDILLRGGCEAAFEAGKLKIIFDDNPNYAEGDGKSVDSSALARLVQFRSGPSLADFGKAYREKFGDRHNP